jgi:TonB-dependent receptor
MKTFSINLLLILSIFSSTQLLSQNGFLKGKITDEATKEPIMFCQILVKELMTGGETDLDGNYNISLKPGKYTIVINYTGYQEIQQQNVEVRSNEETSLEFKLKLNNELLKEVVVTATQIRNTETSINTLKQKKTAMLDGISAQTIKRNGDSNAGDALKRVTGVSIEGGKYAVVRGLSDRYTKIVLNGLELPGLDPDKNSVQLDLIPTNILDNLIVYKTFSPELPGDFTGGAIDIITKEFPEQKTIKASVSLGYNPSMNFKNNFLSYQGGKTDFLGFDDGTRKLPFHKQIVLPDPSLRNPALKAASSAFNSTLGAQETTNDLNKSISFSLGNQKKINEGTLGYVFGINYNHGYTHYDQFELGEYFRNTNDNGYFINRQTLGTLSEINTLWSTLGALSYKKGNNKISIEAMRIQSSDSKAAILTQANMELNSSIIERNSLEFYQRSISNLTVSGKHELSEGKIIVDWKLSPSITSVVEPDIRTTGFDITEAGNPILRPSVGAEVTRIYRNLDETNYNGKLDLTYNFKIKDRESKIRTGFYSTIKQRDFEIYNFLFRTNGQNQLGLNGNPDNILKPENLWNEQTNIGSYVVGNYEPANTFNAKQNILAAYIMNELPVTNKFKITYGVRAENANIRYSGQNNQGNIRYENQKVFDSPTILPSANMIYSFNNKLILRASYNRTLARPTFKENSIAQIQDRISDRTFLGNIGLKQTDINNYDLRLEKFFTGGEIISVSTFYKQFYNPIQLTVYDIANPSNFIPRNFDNANVLGFEFEANKKLSFLSEKFNNFIVSTNYTVVKSTSPLVGLSPSIFNAALIYAGSKSGWEATTTYNVQGKKLSIVGVGRIEDIYENPFKSLNAKVSKTLGDNSPFSVSLLAENILNSKRQRSYNTQDNSSAIFDNYKPGTQFTFTMSYSLK